MKFARWVYLVAGVYGIIATLPIYFYEHQIGIDFPPPVTHPEYFYGFAGVTLVWQLLFLAIAKNPAGFRNVMIFTVLEKASMIPIFLILFPGGRFPSLWVVPAIIDMVLGLLFFIAYRKTGTLQTTAGPA